MIPVCWIRNPIGVIFSLGPFRQYIFCQGGFTEVIGQFPVINIVLVVLGLAVFLILYGPSFYKNFEELFGVRDPIGIIDGVIC